MPRKYIPYSTQSISQQDIDAVVSALKSGWLTGGKKVPEFEKAVADYCDVPFGAAVCNGTAALHAAVKALHLNPGDEVIVPAISFVATANGVVYENCVPVFCDIHPDTLLIDPESISRLITERTRAVITVDYAGQLCNYRDIQQICSDHNLHLIADCCHSLGASHKGKKAGSLADLSVFSFHPVKQITTGEGGMVMTSTEKFHAEVCRFRNHGMSHSASQRNIDHSFTYQIDHLGWNYRITDIQSALGISQLQQLDSWITARRRIAAIYADYFTPHPLIEPLSPGEPEGHGHHLYVVKVPERDRVFSEMRKKNIGVNVHYFPIYLHNYYKNTFKTYRGMCPEAEKAYRSILSLPIYPGLTPEEQRYVIDNLDEIVTSL